MKIRNIMTGRTVGAVVLLTASLCWGFQNNQPQSYKAIHEAVIKGSLKDVIRLLEKGVDVNAKDNNGATPLHVAVRFGQKEVKEKAELLIAKGADVNARDNLGWTPLAEAVYWGFKDLAELVIAKGADVNAEDNNGATPLHKAARMGRKEVVELLIAKGADVNAQDDDGATPLYGATRLFNKDVAELLIVKGADVNATDTYGWTPLHWTAIRGHKDVAELLITKGANVRAKDKNGRTPVRNAALGGDTDVAELLIAQGADVNAKGNDGATPLHDAARVNRKEAAELLIAKGADVNAKDNNGWTPLHSAAFNDYPAIFYRSKNVAELLIAKGADVNAKDKDGTTALHLAAWGGFTEMAELLTAKSADLNAKDNNGRTPLHSAAFNSNPAIFFRIKEVSELLIAKGADVNAKDSIGATPLNGAAVNGNKEVAELLIAKGADVNAKAKDGATLLPTAILYNRKEVVEPKITRGIATLAIAMYTGVNLKTIDDRRPTIYLVLSANATEKDFLGTRIYDDRIRDQDKVVYGRALLPLGNHILGVEYRIVSGDITFARSESMLKIPVAVEDGHIYVLATGAIDDSTWAPVVVDLVRVDLLPSLAAGLKDPDPHERVKATMSAAAALRAGVPSPLAASVLALPLSEMFDDPWSLNFAIQALQELGSFAVPFLLEKINMSDPKMRSQAVRALGELGTEAKDALPSLMKALGDKSLRDITGVALKNIVAAITSKNVEVGEAGLAAFIECLKDPNDDWTRELAAKTLGDIGPGAKVAIPALAEAQKNDRSRQVRNAAEKAVKKIQR